MAQLTTVQATLVGDLDTRRVPRTQGATSTIAWLRHRLHLTPAGASTLTRLHTACQANPTLASAVRSGRVTPEQATLIHTTVTALPAGCGPGLAAAATDHLLDAATRCDPVQLRRAGAHLLTHLADTLDPAVAAAAATALADRAERQAERAWNHRGLHLHDAGDGRTRISGWLDAAGAATLGAALDPLTKPQAEETRTATQRRADALVEIASLALRTTDLPPNGGLPAQLVATMDLDDLRHQVGTATLDTGDLLTPTQVRQLACDLEIIPAVLDGAGQPVDLGRGHRLVNAHLRRALILRDHGCAFPSCDRPARWCQAHHAEHWIDGGPTNLGNTLLTCTYHHRLLHHEGWNVHIGPNGRPEFTPPKPNAFHRTPTGGHDDQAG